MTTLPAMQHLYPLPPWCERRLAEWLNCPTDTYGRETVAIVPLDVPPEMRTAAYACVMSVPAGVFALHGPAGVVVGGSVYLRTPDGLYYLHSHGYARPEQSSYLRAVVGL